MKNVKISKYIGVIKGRLNVTDKNISGLENKAVETIPNE